MSESHPYNKDKCFKILLRMIDIIAGPVCYNMFITHQICTLKTVDIGSQFRMVQWCSVGCSRLTAKVLGSVPSVVAEGLHCVELISPTGFHCVHWFPPTVRTHLRRMS